MSRFMPFVILISLALSSCKKGAILSEALVDQVQIEEASIALEVDWQEEAPIELGKLSYEFAGNVKYGKHRRNKFDIVRPESATPTPLVIYMHGGGFTMGDKNSAYIHSDSIRRFLANGIAFATINYRYLSQTEDGVLSCLEDCKNFLQYVRYYADDFNIDPTKVAAYGPSAGGGAGLWLATHDDLAKPESNDPIARQSTRISAAVALGVQSTYDLARWEEVFAEFDFSLADPMFDQQILFNFYRIDSLSQLDNPEIVAYRAQVDMIDLMDANDASIYVHNRGKATPPKETIDLYHHPYHAHALKERAETVGLSHLIVSQKTGLTDSRDQGPVKFLLQEFRK
ncbi:MAG: alpha/beta hydrolase [Bacteroidota bacterium]